MSLHGGCKCGAVSFVVEGCVTKVRVCNCSICRPKGYLHWSVPDATFHLEAGESALGSFRFKEQVMNHRFCTTCGVSPFVEAPGAIMVNVRCLEGVDLEALPVEQYDGAHH